MNMATISEVILFGLFILFQWTPSHGTRVQVPLLFSDKTPYHFEKKPLVKPPQCEAVHINMVIRHGSRYPGTYTVENMNAVLEKINKFFPKNSVFKYKGLALPWSLPEDIKNSASKELSKLGSEEMYTIAKHLRDMFSSVLNHGYSNTNYSFVATDKLRCSQSAIAFAHGLFEGRGFLGPGKFQPVAVKVSGSYNNDRILRIFEACPKWQRLRNPRSEYAQFLNGPEMRSVAKIVAARLNLTQSLKLSPKMVDELFLACAFGTQTDSFDSSWCSVFEERDLKVLEYLSDLKIYWDRSYGRKINFKMSCLLYKEIVRSINKFLEEGKPHGIFRFAHTGTVVPLLTMLGMYNDSVPLRADNYQQQANRTFRVSNIVPMSGNVALIAYDCRPENDKVSLNDMAFNGAKIKVQLLVNEAAVPMPACRGRMYCSLKRFLSYYSHIQENCDFRAICGDKRKKTKKRPTD